MSAALGMSRFPLSIFFACFSVQEGMCSSKRKTDVQLTKDSVEKGDQLLEDPTTGTEPAADLKEADADTLKNRRCVFVIYSFKLVIAVHLCLTEKCVAAAIGVTNDAGASKLFGLMALP